MAQQPKNMSIIKQVLTGYKNGMSVRKIAKTYSASPTTVQRYLKMAREDSLGIDGLLHLEDTELNHRFNGGNPAYCDQRFEDFKARLPHFIQELQHKRMTVQLLWEEYIQDFPQGYSLTQFRYHLSQNEEAAKSSTLMKPLHQPGAKVYIDFAGDKMSYVDMSTGEIIPVETFAAVLPYSGYTFIKFVPTQGIEHFLDALDSAMIFFGGAPRIIVPDNLRSAVKSFDKWSPGLTDGLNDFATHYGCNALPARVRKPKDKSGAEDAIHKSYGRIYAPLRNHIFYSIEEINEAAMQLLKRYNSKRMQGCDYSRVECFIAAEREALLPLPKERFEMKRKAFLTVAPNSFIKVGSEQHNYSVPSRYIGMKVEVIFTASQVAVFHDGGRIATWPRNMKPGGYTYDIKHLPSQTQHYYGYSSQYFIDKASRYGEYAAYVMRELFSNPDKPTELFYRSAQGILAIARDTEPSLFLLACKIAVEYNKCNYGFILNQVKSKCKGYIMQKEVNEDDIYTPPASHENIRGPKAFE